VEHSEFDLQLKRLRSQWGNSYGDERAAVLWKAFGTCSANDFAEAVTECLANHRSAPLVKEIGDELTKASERRKESDRMDYQARSTPIGQLEDALKKTPNKEFAKECIKILQRKLNKAITPEQFEEACNLLDQAAAIANPAECARCANTGYNVHDKTLFRCSCDWGQSRPEILFGPPDRDGKRSEHRLPVLTKQQWKSSTKVGRERAAGE